LAMFEELGYPVDAVRDDVEALEQRGRTVALVAVDGVLVGLLGLADDLKPNARRAVEALQRLGLRVVMLTGDNER
ncbi:MAG: hypothetical protein C4321_07495, partial [Chloroflexota bacterium]